MNKLAAVLLRDFLKNPGGQTPHKIKTLPFVHTTQSSRLLQILSAGKLFTAECNVFQGENLCYLFVGRPAYKYSVAGEAPYWMLPSVFVVRFQQAPPFKRIYPFDSGAFSRRLLPDYITVFARDDYEIGPDIQAASVLMSIFFGDDKRYWRRQASSEEDFRQKYSLGPLHMQIEALNRLYGDRSNSFDDRAAVLEVQTDKDVSLSPSNVLGIVVPEEYLRDANIKTALKSISPNIEPYGMNPVNVQMYFGQIYECVQRIYGKFGIMK